MSGRMRRVRLTRISTAAATTALLILGGTATARGQTADKAPTLSYAVDLNDRADDQFHVSMVVSGLGPDNAILQFASTAPGTYQVMDVGRYVSELHAFSSDGTELGVEQVSTNQWRLDDPAAVSEIRYSIAETWDTPVDEHPGVPDGWHVHRRRPRADQRARRLPLPHRDAGRSDRAPPRVPGGMGDRDAARHERRGRLPGRRLRSLRRLPAPAGPPELRQHHGHRRAGRDLHLLGHRQDPVGAAPGGHGPHPAGVGGVPWRAPGGPLHVPVSLRGAESDGGRVGALVQL